jgi:hypothetical protein
MPDLKYIKPERRIHRGFFYLDDETVINSLSAVEAGKVDEVVAKINSAREGGIAGGVGVGLGPAGAKLEGGKKASSSLEEEMVRTRTRFSVFEIWYQNLVDNKAIGRFEGWNPTILETVEEGDTIEMKATLSLAPLQIVLRQYLWFAERAKAQGHPMSQKGEELKSTKEGERTVRMLLGNAVDEDDQLIAFAIPDGEPGPNVVMLLSRRWIVGQVGNLSGRYTAVAQVDRIAQAGDELPTLRLIRDVPPTALELDTLREMVGNFIEPAKTVGVELTENESTVTGPAVWLTPVAIFR